ncbi:SRPBCC domain-containing protein [Paenibacillus chondroitinus]|uniref:SRPBCC domain-containing protein n=1 Tax=Paenibacillus chondroitinus TaxID=59842 RepID=A0ABU6DL78_9BACL|nr:MULTISPECIES: SRPBCC domain-containing protein [Paenibacillus]MCY9661386.1 SRPBCC domain-containing protein [Paenibacillus anseongense]MEB4798537.1 SRPBCC domain-containing protein [Paenibacillus chondroitinus]
METTSSSEMIKKEIFIACRPETLFSFFTDPDKLVRWMGRNVLLDPSIGGKFRIDLNGSDIALGEYKEITPNEKVVMTWGWERSKVVPPGSSTVEFKLIPKDNGTLLEFTHYDLPATEIADHVKGWSHFLPRIQMVAEAGEAGRVPSSEQV